MLSLMRPRTRIPLRGERAPERPEVKMPAVSVRGVLYRRRENGRIEYLILQRSENVKNNPLQWQLVGGTQELKDKIRDGVRIPKDPSLVAALQREKEEELGPDFVATEGLMRYLGQHTYKKIGGDKAGEHKAHRWITFYEAESRTDFVPGVLDLLRMAHKKLKRA